MYWCLAKGFGSDKLYLKLLLAHLRALDLMQYFLARLSATLAKEMLPHLNFFIIDNFSVYLSWSSFLPARAGEQGNVIGSVSVYIYIAIYIYICHQKKL